MSSAQCTKTDHKLEPKKKKISGPLNEIDKIK